MKEVILDAQARTVGSKGDLAFLRKSGKIPAIFYGKGIKPEAIAVSSKVFVSIMEANGANVIINLNFKDGKKAAIVKSLDRDFLTQHTIHIDFHAISLEDKIEVLVPVHIAGVADGVRNFGGVMEFIVREVKVEAIPRNIPQKISVDVKALRIGQGITVADLPELDGVKYVQDSSTLIVHVIAVAAVFEEEKPEAMAGGTATVVQPEVIISKGKKDKEVEEAEKGTSVASPTTATGGTKK
ncbi:50S ribosomal protein L25/general stress protein Ctc [Endomicrobiia bacterium]|nr:50S ribosomal protein L25/general stress protein Ctc [Endomicrobiia bacterium]GHT12227.1 50S ribosomal protein L25/general stress protein Ctc [Endomicrobiia bacterium]GHT20558.1 50S ribosomal protein L25/general stress protein Ctc [Endomicrobiia bacterium]GHT26152.1 50S ribosomal protein L25/general stress protein Ctc [Endomicrobiia bacterium]GHT31456.1 50S ribosomal protein L25/general stress protein Ctc [Endomicrobiia bacterium]